MMRAEPVRAQVSEANAPLAAAGGRRPFGQSWFVNGQRTAMFKQILLADRGDSAAGVAAKPNCAAGAAR